MQYELISPEEIESLPEDDELCFVELEAICRRNMLRVATDETRIEYDRMIQFQYMITVSSAASECGLYDLVQDDVFDISNQSFDFQFRQFSTKIQGYVSRFLIRNRKQKSITSVSIGETARAKVTHYINRLREYIDNSDFPNAEKNRLQERLEELSKELNAPRSNLGKIFRLLGIILVPLAALTTIAADGPSAITNIVKIVAEEKQIEENSAPKLQKPTPKSLPSSNHSLDDDIPF